MVTNWCNKSGEASNNSGAVSAKASSKSGALQPGTPYLFLMKNNRYTKSLV